MNQFVEPFTLLHKLYMYVLDRLTVASKFVQLFLLRCLTEKMFSLVPFYTEKKDFQIFVKLMQYSKKSQ